MVEFVIPLNPVTKKNSNVRTKNGGVIASKAYRAYEKDALKVIPPKVRLKLSGRLNVRAVYYTKIDYYRKGCKAKIDLNNLHNALMDVLVAAGVLSDDNCRIVYTMDGSKVLCDKKNPRTEVLITEVEDGE